MQAPRSGSNPARVTRLAGPSLGGPRSSPHRASRALPLQPDRLVRFHRLRDRFLDREPLHTGSTVEAMDSFRPMQDISGIRRFRDRAAVTKNNHIRVDRFRSVSDLLNLSWRIL